MSKKSFVQRHKMRTKMLGNEHKGKMYTRLAYGEARSAVMVAIFMPLFMIIVGLFQGEYPFKSALINLLVLMAMVTFDFIVTMVVAGLYTKACYNKALKHYRWADEQRKFLRRCTRCDWWIKKYGSPTDLIDYYDYLAEAKYE